MNFTLEQVMTEFPYTIQAHESAERAHELMLDHQVRHLPVEADGRIIGVLSDRDVNLAMSLRGGRASPVSVFSLCSKPAYMVTKDEPITLVLRTMAEQRYGCVLVAERGRLVGIATTSDLLRWMSAWLEAAGETTQLGSPGSLPFTAARPHH